MLWLTLWAVPLGLVTGAAAIGIVHAVGVVSWLALLHRLPPAGGPILPNLRSYRPGLSLAPIALAGGAAVALLARWSPVIRGHGIPETLEAIQLRGARIPPRAALAKPLSAAIAMGTGGPFGAEGPVIVTGGSLGSLLGQRLAVSAAERTILLAAGAAAGMAGVFGTPLAAVVITFELLACERSLRLLLPTAVAVCAAAAVHSVGLGRAPLFAAGEIPAVPAVHLVAFVAAGLLAGVLAVIVARVLALAEAGFDRLPVPAAWHPVIGAGCYALIGLAVPGTLSVGYWAIHATVTDRFALGSLAVLVGAKLVSWWLALASNTSGGTLAPIFLVGAGAGLLLGHGMAGLLPGWHLAPAAVAIATMGAVFGAAARAPLTSALFALEVTGTWQLSVPVLLTVTVATAVAQLGLTEGLMTDRLARRGRLIDFDSRTDPLRAVSAATLARPAVTPVPVAAIPAAAPVADALAWLLDTPQGEVAVYDADGAPLGVVGMAELAQTWRYAQQQERRQPGTLRRNRPAPAEATPP